MDAILHAERLDGRDKRTYPRTFAELPDGAMIATGGVAYAVRGEALLRWSPHGYAAPVPRPRNAEADVLTPPAIVAVLRAGYAPRWHDSAGPR
jgi:hypothetical protein